jgi:hypothetical protein
MNVKPLVGGAAALAIGIAGCGGGGSSSSSRPANPNQAEVSPAGDIPDNQAYVPYSPPGSSYTVKVPEGWSRTSQGGAVVFTDKLNAIRMESHPARSPVTPSSVRRQGKASVVTRRAGKAVRVTYLAKAKPNPVTGKTGQDAVERYYFFHKGNELVLTLSGPKGADNVDPWKIVTDSVRWH